MTSFQEARAFLLKHRTDYDAAVKGFRWPDPVPFNWALDWFDAELARNADSKDRAALWIVDAGSNRETKLSFEALSRRSNQVANFATWSCEATTTLARPRSSRSRSSSGVSNVVAGITTTPSFIAASMVSHSGTTLPSNSSKWSPRFSPCARRKLAT